MISRAQLKTVGCAKKTNNQVKSNLANTSVTTAECSIYPYIRAPPPLECPLFCLFFIDDADDR